MNRDPRDALDQAIDEVLASMAAGEPRGVDAASVRKAMGERRAPSLPVWFAAAAVLVVAFGVWMKGRLVAPSAPATVTRPVMATGSERMNGEPTPVPEGPEVAPTVSLASSPTKLSAIKARTEPPYEGLARIVIAAIEQPEPLTTPALEADALSIPPIEIPTLSVPSLSHALEQPQEKPQS